MLYSILSASIILICVAVLFILYFTEGHNFNKYDPPSYDYSLFDKNTILTETQTQQDKNELIYQVENTHPYLLINEVAGYETAKQRFLDTAITTASDFYFAAAEYLAVFKDLHTTAIANFSERVELDISSYLDNDKLMMYPYGEENQAAELYAINNVPYKDIFIKYTSMENKNSITQGIPRIYITDFLIKAGIEWTDMLTFTYKDVNGNFFDVDHSIIFQPSDGDNSEASKNFEAMILDNGVLYIYARSMNNDGSYSECINFIKTAVANGIKKVIIDVTGNIGGSDNFGSGILNALGFSYSRMGMTIRYCEATAKYRGTWRSSGYRTRDFLYRSKNVNSIKLKVFCDEYTASAAVSGIVAQCRYSDLGEIIGRMPGQNANFCGNATIFQLTNSKVAYMLPLSYGYYERNGKKAPDQLTVDIEVPATSDYMDFVTWKLK